MRPTRSLRILSTVFIAIAFCCPAAKAQSYRWQSLTSDDAIQVVRSFEGNQTLAVTVIAMPPSSPNGPAANIGYTLATAGNTYKVCQFTPNQLSRFTDLFADVTQYYGQPYDASALQQQGMSRASAQAIADAFVQSRYPSPSILSSPTVSLFFNLDPAFTATYTFRYNQDCGNGVYGPSFCEVTVDTVKGQVVYFGESYFPVLISTTPALTGDQATAAAMNSLQISGGVPGQVTLTGISKPDPLGAESLYYELTFVGQAPTDTFPEDYVATVDANNGNVLDDSITAALGPRPRLKPSPAFLKLRARIAAKMARDGKRLDFRWNGRPTRVNYPPRLIHGRVYFYSGYLSHERPSSPSILHPGKKVLPGSGQGETETVTVGRGRQSARFVVGSRRWQLNGRTLESPAPALMVGGKCYVSMEVARRLLTGLSYNPITRQVCYQPANSAKSND